MAKVVKSVSFNDTKEEDIKILNFIENQNFGGYIKTLMLEDIERRSQPLRIVKRSEKGGITYIVPSNTPPLSSQSV
jgi:hypothetical protein